MTGITADEKPSECDRCGDEIHELEPVTSIQFSGGVDAHRMVCHGRIQDIIEVWNEGDAVAGDDRE